MNINSPKEEPKSNFEKVYATSRLNATEEHLQKEEYFRLSHTIASSRSPEKVLQNEQLDQSLRTPIINTTLTEFNVGLALSQKAHNALSLPVSCRLKGGCLMLQNYRINEELAQSLAENIRQLGSRINEVLIDSSVYSRNTLSYILSAITSTPSITSLRLKNLPTHSFTSACPSTLNTLLFGSLSSTPQLSHFQLSNCSLPDSQLQQVRNTDVIYFHCFS